MDFPCKGQKNIRFRDDAVNGNTTYKIVHCHSYLETRKVYSVYMPTAHLSLSHSMYKEKNLIWTDSRDSTPNAPWFPTSAQDRITKLMEDLIEDTSQIAKMHFGDFLGSVKNAQFGGWFAMPGQLTLVLEKSLWVVIGINVDLCQSIVSGWFFRSIVDPGLEPWQQQLQSVSLFYFLYQFIGGELSSYGHDQAFDDIFATVDI